MDKEIEVNKVNTGQQVNGSSFPIRKVKIKVSDIDKIEDNTGQNPIGSNGRITTTDGDYIFTVESLDELNEKLN